MPSADNSKSGPWKSYLRYYFIEGHRTPSAPLNSILDMLKQHWDVQFSDFDAVLQSAEHSGITAQIQQEVLQIVRVWEAKHLGERFFESKKGD